MISKLLEFLEEDLGKGDITTSSVIPTDKVVEAEVVAKESGILAGLEEVELLLEHFQLEWTPQSRDGDDILEGDVILRIKGRAAKILTMERLMLNLLMRMSGIATATRELVKRCEGYGVDVAGTRKTTPGLRILEKKAIVIGGGKPHRMRLDEAVLIKDNHLAVVGIEEAIKRAKKKHPRGKIEVEVSSLEQAVKACKLGVGIIMLDNLEVDESGRIFRELEDSGLRKQVEIELSGGITLENVEEYAKLRPDVISTGYPTTKAKWLDMSLRIT
ncbi:MAG: carboxylating nicotinate-nucleotide diphosphorylase [Candidatus Hydrothermarchaeales archaeon]